MLTIRAAQLDAFADARPNEQIITPCQNTKTWVEFRLVDTEDRPVPAVKFLAQLPDGSKMEGVLDENGAVRFESIMAGTCSISFPEIDASEWWPV